MALSIKRAEDAAEIIANEAYRILKNEFRMSHARAGKAARVIYLRLVQELTSRE